jgi:hypothetical protein
LPKIASLLKVRSRAEEKEPWGSARKRIPDFEDGSREVAHAFVL